MSQGSLVDGSNMVEGRRAVAAALDGPRAVHRLMIAAGSKGLDPLIKEAEKQGITVSELSRQELSSRSQTQSAQGVLAEVEPLYYKTTGALLSDTAASGDPPFFLVAAGIQDPHNLGAILRTSEAVGVQGVIIPKDRACGITPGTIKAAAGAVEYVPVCRVTNLVRTVDRLKHEGLWFAAADTGGSSLCWEVDLTGALGLVIGGEHQGVPRLLAEHCDFRIRLPMSGRIGSLNASVAAAVLLYEVRRQRFSRDTGFQKGPEP